MVDHKASATKVVKTLVVKTMKFNECDMTYAKMFMLYGTVTDTTFLLDDFQIFNSSTMGDSTNKDNSVFIDLGGPL